MLELQDISVVFNPDTIHEKVALSHIHLQIQKGDFVTIIGSNGAGKSTLFQTICGAITPQQGRIYLEHQDITSLKEHKRSRFIGRLFQDPLKGTAPSMTIAENLSLASCHGHYFRLTPISLKQRHLMQEALKELDLGLEERMDTKVGVLSGGQRQALSLLMATYGKPQLLLLDEHTAALDPQTAQKVLDLTAKIVKKEKMTTLMITHNMEDALKYGQKILIMKDGKIIDFIDEKRKQDLTVDKLIHLYSSKTHDYNDRLLL
ncbi:ATP-binding cassette domain-containing protein [Allocoprobacillus halotolerans]|uniref:ATP-binding cassette domain-containing protein n=1 Tax=Allocoprobacillus halotolerans TaxID=2944914 RepID=A0ABY5I012_9FIRM|nr:ATP-binding cassette domain-containing protein [Allocoprobacillus halotolerans]UTY38681.1 ATP-binding cassette domain-containing protein [Allocoprobacillus halotolerans]